VFILKTVIFIVSLKPPNNPSEDAGQLLYAFHRWLIKLWGSVLLKITCSLKAEVVLEPAFTDFNFCTVYLIVLLILYSLM
jgi:hypothetical protein